MNLIKNNRHRNYIILFLEGIFFHVGLVFFDASTILPLLMNKFTDSSILVGLLGMAPGFSMGITAVLAGNYGRSLPYKKKFILTASSVGRLSLWILGLSLIFIPFTNPFFWAGLILFIQYLFWLADGAVFTAWSDLINKSISERLRGRFLSLVQIVGGTIAIFAGKYVTKILKIDFLSFPTNYGVIITIGALLFTFSIIMFASVREQDRSSTSKSDSPRELIKKIPVYFRSSAGFSRAMLTLFFCTLATIALPFFIVYAEKSFGLAESTVGAFVSLRIGGRIIGALAFGFVGDRLGHEKSITIFALSASIPAFMALIVKTWMPDLVILGLFYMIFLFIGIMQAGAWMAFMNYTIDLVAGNQLTLFAGFIQLVRVPASVAPFFGGLIANTGGYLTVFVLSAIFALIGTYFSLILPAAERTGGISENGNS
ncbi:MAG: MFS transporter [Halanaerobiaceae bacterium]